MAIARMTQNMMLERSYVSLQTVSGRLSKTQEHLTTGRVLNRPSDSPTDTSSAMRLRASIAEENQYQRNAQDGLGWLGQIDSTLTTALDQLRNARDVGIQGRNGVNIGSQAREALAVQVEQLRESLIGVANTTYLGRPVFGGATSGTAAYDGTGTFVGTAADVSRSIAKDAKVPVNANGPKVFGPDDNSLFDNLSQLADALRAGDSDGIGTALGSLDTAQTRITSALTDVGTRYARVERAMVAAQDSALSLSTALSGLEEVDIARATIDLNAQEVAYKAAMAATARLVQPSLADFLR